MKLALSTDHAGFQALQELQAFLESKGHNCINFGPKQFNPADDYPDFVTPTAQAVSSGECQAGIIFGGSGQGEAMAANRVKGVRCALYYGPAMPAGVIDAEGHTATDEYEIVRLSRQHNDANMLSLAGRFLSQKSIEQAVTLWLETPFTCLERHQRRINELDA